MEISNAIDIEQDDMVKLLALYYHRPDLFVEQVLNIKLDPQQLDLIYNLYKYEWVTVRSGKGPGKTFAAAVLVWHFLITRALSKVFITAPAASQMAGSIWSELSLVYNKLPQEFKEDWEFLNTKITNKSDPHEWYCMQRVARRENPEALRGSHGEDLLYIIDEATGVPDESYETISSTLTGKRNYLLLLSNPNTLSGFFYDSHLPDASKIYKQMHFSCFESSQVSKESIKRAKMKYGEESIEYRVNVLGEFPISETDSIILADWVRDAIKRDINDNDADLVWGLDIGSGGVDPSILIKRKGRKVYNDIKEWRERDLMNVVGRVLKEYKSVKDKPTAIFIDSAGLGQGVADRLIELKLPVVKTNGAFKPINKKVYANLKSEMYFEMRNWFRNDEPSIPNDMELVKQLYTIKSTYSSAHQGRLMVEDKFAYRKRNNGKSPDKADALALTFNKKKNKKAAESLFFI